MEKRLFGTIRHEPRESSGWRRAETDVPRRRLCPPLITLAEKLGGPGSASSGIGIGGVPGLRSMGWMGPVFSAKVIYSPQKVPW